MLKYSEVNRKKLKTVRTFLQAIAENLSDTKFKKKIYTKGYGGGEKRRKENESNIAKWLVVKSSLPLGLFFFFFLILTAFPSKEL